MADENKTALAALVVAAALVPAVLGLALGWPLWVSVLLALLLLAVPALVHRHLLARREETELTREWEQQRAAASTEQPVERPFSDHHVDVELPSASPDFDFRFSVTVWWRVGGDPIGVRHHNPRALAADLVLCRAREIAAAEPPTRRSYLQTRLDGVLGCRLSDQSGQVEAYATDARVELADEDAARLRRLADLRRAGEDWERERDLERSKREYYGQEVMKDTGSALVWWLVQQAHTAHDVDEAVRLIGSLAELTAAVNGTEIPERFRGYVRESGHLRPDSPGALAIGGGAHRPFELGSAEGAALNGTFRSGALHHGAPESTSGPAAPADDLSATDLLGKMLDRLFDGQSSERALTARRIAQFVEGAGHAETAEEIRRSFDVPAHAARHTIE